MASAISLLSSFSRTGELIEARVRAISIEAANVRRIELDSPTGARFPGFSPGAHIDMHLPNGALRQYSLINADDGHRYVIAVALDRVGRGGSRWIFEHLQVGQTLLVSTPRNTFPLDETNAPSVLLAGGIGITPILAMARGLQSARRPKRVVYAARSRKEAAFVEELSSLDALVEFHFDDEAGALLDVAAVVGSAPCDAHLYCCGPAGMISAFEFACAKRSKEFVHVERFAAAPLRADAGGFVIELARSDLTLEVGPAQTILEVVHEAGVVARSSCLNGVCGTCETRVLEGRPDHRDHLLSPTEREAGASMMICCSRSFSPRLRLDL